MMGTKVYDSALDLITFSRASGGTALRKISYGSELVTNGTFDTDSDWTKGAGWTISGGAATHAAGVSGSLSQNISLSAGKVYSITVDATASGGTWYIQFRTGTTVTVASGLGTGSYTFQAVALDTNDLLSITGGTATDLTIDNISVKEVLFDQPDGTLTLFNHPDNIPRIEYAADGTVKGLLIEEQRTNLVTYSEDFTDASWAKGAVTVTANDTAAPDGTSTADKVVWTATTAYHSIFPTITVSELTTYTRSVYVKYAGVQWIHIQQYDSGGSVSNYGVWFDIQNGIKGSEQTGCTGTIQDAGNGWYRCSVAFTTTAGTTTERVQIALTTGDGVSANSQLGDGTSGIYVWGAQLEAGSFPTSYISTSGSAATRSADLASIPVSDFGYNQKAGTVVVEYNYVALNSGRLGRFVELNGTSPTSERILLYANYGTTNAYLQIRDNGADSVGLNNYNTPLGEWNIAAITYKTDSSNICTNGVLNATDTSVVVPDDITKMDIGRADSNAADVGQAYIKSIQYYPRRLTNTQLQELTA